VTFGELLGESDVVTIHLRLSDRTRGLIGAGELSAMRRHAYLVNTSRGPIVDTAALVTALHEGWIAGAGLDVFDVEPLPPEHPLRAAPNALLTPHVGYVTYGTYGTYYTETVDNIAAFLAGAPRILDRHQDILPGRRIRVAIVTAGQRAMPIDPSSSAAELECRPRRTLDHGDHARSGAAYRASTAAEATDPRANRVWLGYASVVGRTAGDRAGPASASTGKGVEVCSHLVRRCVPDPGNAAAAPQPGAVLGGRQRRRRFGSQLDPGVARQGIRPARRQLLTDRLQPSRSGVPLRPGLR
jgi:hypothetical protein